MGQIEDYIADLENVKDLYYQNWSLPYASAYVTAHESFKATLQSQADLDKLKAELFLTVATIGFGAGLGAVFGKAALSTVLADQALTAVCNRNMIRTFNTMAAISSSVPGTFIVEQIWSTLSSKVSDAAKRQVQDIYSRSPISAALQNPQVFQNDLQAYVLRIKTAAHQVAADIRDNRTMSETEKNGVVARLRAAPFFANAPRTDLIGARQSAADKIELGFYMTMIMNSDYIKETTFYTQGAHEGTRTRRVGAVDRLTTDRAYANVPASTSSYGFGYSNSTMYDVAYDSPGSRIMSRINTLYQAQLRGEFIGDHWYGFDSVNRQTVAKAERAIELLGNLVRATPGA